MKFGDLIDGMLILGRYADPEDYLSARNDMLFVGSAEFPVTEDEKAELIQLGFFLNEDEDCWSCYF